MNKNLKQGSGVKSEISPADGKPKLSAVNFQFLYKKNEMMSFHRNLLP